MKGTTALAIHLLLGSMLFLLILFASDQAATLETDEAPRYMLFAENISSGVSLDQMPCTLGESLWTGDWEDIQALTNLARFTGMVIDFEEDLVYLFYPYRDMALAIAIDSFELNEEEEFVPVDVYNIETCEESGDV